MKDILVPWSKTGVKSRKLEFSINLPYGHTWNNVVISVLVSLVATWNC